MRFHYVRDDSYLDGSGSELSSPPTEADEEPFKVKTPTKNMVDGNRIKKLPGAHEVTGTHTYTTRGGTNTVLDAEKQDTKPMETLLKTKSKPKDR